MATNRGVALLVAVCFIIVIFFATTDRPSSSSSPSSADEPADNTPAPAPVLIDLSQRRLQDEERKSNNNNRQGAGGKVAINKDGKVIQPIEGCDDVLPDVPLSPLEQELKRLLHITLEVLREKHVVGWAADGTLLGLVRNGRVATDRDIDFNIHSTYAWCASTLHSLKGAFEKRAGPLRMFKVVYAKVNGRKVGRYAMIRMPPVYGTFGTGVDFNCVYNDDPQNMRMHVHKGSLEVIPAQAFPLSFCLGYGLAVPCPRDPMAVLGMFTPRYDGCMVFPHCTGDPLYGNRKCLAPHPPMPRKQFVRTTLRLDQCGWVSLKKHYGEEPLCSEMENQDDSTGDTCMPKSDDKQRWPICFLQKYVG